ncbi:hypothetical protein GT568_06530 [Coprococcus sp. BIOML-A1]|uniref:hypothetical protein n=1 Tax=unclassified Coprococcus TaxID=2684943 RepID=UPI00136DB44E|nr:MULTISPECIES: hypothetical protein [unclassified Coprococcus]MZK38510.1 hypothetical protein [Coprococcus sp. BIOML-A1]MZK63462.1 hypothetical protein [Coprococcus sp. BIOML-A2]
MIERLKRKLRHNDDHGSSFVLVIVATTFMCILASAILMGAMMTYKLKFYKLNSLNNFYEVETALDEMYAGVGAATNEHLYSAYTTTAELVVVYDTKAQAYTTLDNKSANELFKKLFMTGFVADTNYNSLKNVTDTLQSFISNEYDAVDNPDGVRLDTSNMKLIYTDVNNKTTTQYYKNNGGIKTEKQSGYENDKVQSVTFKNVCVKRSVDLQGSTAGTYEQSITTDIVLTEPEYNVSFDTSSVSNNTLYEYAILADMGVEVGEDNDNRTTDAQVKGNIYAASDYYNKDYNDVAETKVTNKYESKPTTMWGTKESSAYSGIFVNGKNSTLTLNSDVVVCSGSLAAYNGAEINLSGRTQTLSELWADNIVIGGKDGGSLKASADAYIFDDTELNAEKASLKFTQGSYFGYSYNAQDTRSLNYLRQKGYLATGYKLRSHFSDSAIIVNGKNSTLDLQDLNSLYIAGKSYIEFSKIAASSVPEDDENITVDENADYAFTTLKDYSTGQSLDVKTNQLMFLTQWSVVNNTEKVDPDTGITTVTLQFPKTFEADANILDLYDDFLKDLATEGEKGVTAIKQTVSGHDYYYLYIEDGKDSSNVSNAEKFAEKYYKLLQDYGDEISSKLYNVQKYEQFQVKLVLPAEGKINASGAVTDQNNDDSLFLRASTTTTMDVATALDNVSTGKVFTNILGNKGTDNNKKAFNDLKADALKLAGSGTASDEEQTSTFLSYMYINMKDHLSVLNNVDDKTKRTQNAWEIANYTSSSVGYLSSYDKDRDTYSYDYSITPLNHYVDLAYVFSKNLSIEKTIGNATDNEAKTIVINSGDVKLQPNNGDGSFQGIIIAGGNVRFDENVKSFRGMIITGSKLIIDHNMSISADAAFVANLLEQCSESTDEKLNTLTTKVLKNYTSSKSEGNTEVTGASISDISYEDILVFQNWKKNVE